MPDAETRILDDVWGRLKQGRDDGEHAFRTAALATADALGRPDVRTVVLRDVDSVARTLDFQTDRRSPKFAALHHNAAAAWLFYDRVDRLQLRIAATAVGHTRDEVAAGPWDGVPEAARQPYRAAVAPGTPLAGPDTRPESTGDGRDHFAVVRCLIESIEWLRLENGVWRRLRFTWPDTRVQWQWLAP